MSIDATDLMDAIDAIKKSLEEGGLVLTKRENNKFNLGKSAVLVLAQLLLRSRRMSVSGKC